MEELDEIKPGFEEQGKKNPFIVPEGYFEGFSERLHERMGVLEEPAGKRAGRKILRPAFVYIAGFCLLLILVIIIPKIIRAPRTPRLNSEINMANLVQYSIENIDEQTIIEALPKSDKDTVAPEITREDVINYLQEQNIDLNNLNEEL
jgi:hypothetical protein